MYRNPLLLVGLLATQLFSGSCAAAPAPAAATPNTLDPRGRGEWTAYVDVPLVENAEYFLRGHLSGNPIDLEVIPDFQSRLDKAYKKWQKADSGLPDFHTTVKGWKNNGRRWKMTLSYETSIDKPHGGGIHNVDPDVFKWVLAYMHKDRNLGIPSVLRDSSVYVVKTTGVSGSEIETIKEDEFFNWSELRRSDAIQRLGKVTWDIQTSYDG